MICIPGLRTTCSKFRGGGGRDFVNISIHVKYTETTNDADVLETDKFSNDENLNVA